MSIYAIKFHKGWDIYFSKLEVVMKKRVMKKILQLQYDISARHLKQGLPFYVVELGQYRLCFTTDKKTGTKTLFFVGNHKEYEKWLKV